MTLFFTEMFREYFAAADMAIVFYYSMSFAKDKRAFKSRGLRKTPVEYYDLTE